MSIAVEAWVDGSVYPRNPGTRSSGAAILVYKDLVSVLSNVRVSKYETNNTGEIMAIVNAIRLIKTKKPVVMNLYSDSEYALGGLDKLMARGRAYKKNADLWRELQKEIKSRPNLKIIRTHVPGHAGVGLNDLAHEFAYAAAVLEVGTYIERKSLEEVNDLLKEEQGRVKAHQKLQGRAAKAGFKKG